MTKRIFKIISVTILICCLFCSSLIVHAEETTLDFQINIQPVVSETQTNEETEKETQKETQKETEKETQKQTEKETNAPTREPSPQPDRNENANNTAANRPSQTTTEPATEEESTEKPLPEGQFYVFLQKNNGEKRLKTVMKGEGLVPAPSDPVRKGYIFDGWYTDPKFKNEWHFSTDIAKKEMTIYAKWIADESTVTYDIIVKQSEGGIIEVNPSKASEGEIVTVTVTPDKGKRLIAGSLLINGAPSDILSFSMPKGKVKVSASFEDIPASAQQPGEEKSILPLIIVAAVILIIAIAIIAVIMAKRRTIYENGFDPDEAEAEAPEYYDDWVDETIIVEDGFKEGKIIKENAEPDFGLPDSDEEDE